jgi:hypothetical protein
MLISSVSGTVAGKKDVIDPFLFPTAGAAVSGIF